MKITIDTKQDSHEEIQKVIEILRQVVFKVDPPSTERMYFNSDTENNFPRASGSNSSTGFVNMFGDGVSSTTTSSSSALSSPSGLSSSLKENIQDRAPDFGSFLNLTKAKAEKNPEVKIEFF